MANWIYANDSWSMYELHLAILHRTIGIILLRAFKTTTKETIKIYKDYVG